MGECPNSVNMGRGQAFGISDIACSPVATMTAQLSLTRFGLQRLPEHEGDDGINDSPFQQSEANREIRARIAGSIEGAPRPEELRYYLPLIFGGAWSTDQLKPDCACKAAVFGHKGRFKTHYFGGCQVSQATFSSSSGNNKLRLSMDLVGKTFTTEDLEDWPSLSLSDQQPFVHKDSVFTIGGDTFKLDDFSLNVNNNVNTDLFYNSATPYEMPTGDQVYTLTHTSPFDTSTEEALLDIGEDSAAVVLTYTNGVYMLKFTFPAMQSPIPTPVVNGKNQPVRHEGITWTARTVTGGPTNSDGKLVPVVIDIVDTIE
ncbi:phage tail tube protein [Rosistilla oblonga]|uniref:phage tail tube protein n=1 Tax=Rosistilla oblonga TaxID=2527990 RepID=UPI003A9727B7